MSKNMDREFKCDNETEKCSKNKDQKILHEKKMLNSKRRKKISEDSKETKILSPSDYIKQITTNPENIVFKKSKELNESFSFTANPKIVVFQRYKAGDVYSITLSIRNTSQLPQHIKLKNFESVVFNVIHKGSTLNTRLAPGMTHIYEVEFHPFSTEDFFHDLIFNTNAGSFIVPIIAVGPRPLLSFPDQIDMGQTAVKVDKTKPILLQNIGDHLTGFSIFSDNLYFTITPTKASLEPGKAIQIKVTFIPKSKGISNGHLHLRYESGHTVQSVIYGEAVECDVHVRNENIVFETTYLGLSRIETIFIENSSDFTLQYEWVNYESVEKDLEERERCKQAIEPIDIPKDDSVSPSINELIRQRIYSDKIDSLMNANFAYNDKNFTLFPMKGEVWARQTVKILVTFKPQEVNDISTITYLEIGGREHRVPVTLSGKCIGPTLELNLLSLDVQEVYLCSTYNYEVVCKNVGPIPASLMYVQKSADFGSTITVEPPEVVVDVDQLKSTKLSFCSDRTGNFIERVDFLIKESSEVLSFVMKGTVIWPLEIINTKKIDFDPASIGFTMKKQLCLRNLSHAPIEFSVKFPSDGYETAITYEEFATAKIKPKLPQYPCEFFVKPNNDVIEPQKILGVQIFYTPNIVRSGESQIHICLCKSNNAEPLLIPMTFNAKSATFDVTPAEINIRFCFINFPYYRNLTIINNSDVDGYFCIIPQEVSNDTSLLYSLSTYQGHLKPGKSKEIEVTIIVKTISEQKVHLNLFSLGIETPELCCNFICKGQGPVVTVEPSFLDLGEVKLLEKKSLELELINDSPIAAEFTISINRNKTIWDVVPSYGELSANETTTIDVSVFLRDTGKYSDRLNIKIFNGKTISVNLFAIGVGTCIVFDPEIFPEFNMGLIFTHRDTSIPITVKNEGTKHHYLLLTNIEKIRQARKATTEDLEKGKFKIEPNVIELLPGSMQTIYCNFRWDTKESVSEPWYVYATIDNQGKCELIGISTFIATFIKPNMNFSKNELTFKIDLGYNYKMLQQEDELQIVNQSGRDLNAHITIDHPFLTYEDCNCLTNDINVFLKNNEPIDINIYFPFDTENFQPLPQSYIGYFKIEYQEHKNIDKILCKAEINFPHLVFETNIVNLFCETGYSDEQPVKVTNDSPLPAFFKIKWLKETFKYESLSSLTNVGESEGSITTDSIFNNTPLSNSSLNNNTEQNTILNANVEDDALNNDDLNKFRHICNCAEEWKDACSCSVSEENSIDLIDKLLLISPNEGKLLPYSEQYISFIFNGLERAKISIDAVCEIAQGSAQILIINATSDVVKCDIEDRVLDYGLQLFCESSVTTLKLYNQCMIPLKWIIEPSTNLLQIIEGPEVLESDSENLISIERLPSAPGLYNEKIFLEVMHLEPFIIDVKWLATIPQIYLDVPRQNAFQTYPAEFGYQAVQLVMSESVIQDTNLFESDCASHDIDIEDLKMSEYELTQFNNDDWQVIPKDGKYPREIDIDMAFERIIIKNYINSSELSLSSNLENQLLFYLLAPTYVIKMNYVVVDQTAQVSILVKNYGYEKAKVKLKKEEQKRKSPKSCFYVQLDKKTEICQCEHTSLNVAFIPKKEIFSQMRTDVSYKFYLQVKQGLTIPVTVKATAVYPFITVNTQTLNFEKVFVGQCREMSFLLKNEGFVDCFWKLYIEDTFKNATKVIENPFYVRYTNDVTNTGEESIVKVYFKPYKNGNQKRNLIITVQNGQKSETICLTGCGCKRKLNINKTEIQFTPVVPDTTAVENNIIIENMNSFAVQLYWQHLNTFSEANRIARVLKHYYQTDEILIPQRTTENQIPEALLDFYNNLIYQMCSDEHYKSFIENSIKDIILEDYSQSGTLDSSRTSSDRKQKSKSSINSKKLKSKQKIEKNNSSTLLAALLNNDPNEIEILLHAYIDKLQENSNFSELLKDPLSELFENTNYDENDKQLSEKTNILANKIMIIFHGAPYTEYQETACRTAKVLNLPLLNLNQIFLEALTIVETDYTQMLAEQLNSRYTELIPKLQKLPSNKALMRHSASENSNKTLRLIKKIPPIEELEKMDVYTRYENKLELVVQILDLIESINSSESPKAKDKSKQNVRRQSTFPGLGQEIFENILQERLSTPKYKRGYVLQTLNNGFIKNELLTMRTLLEATNYVETYIFVTFHNSFETYERRIFNLILIKEEEERAKMEEAMKKFSEMTQKDIDLLPEEEKLLYDEIILKQNQETIEKESFPRKSSENIDESKTKKVKSRDHEKEDTESISFKTDKHNVAKDSVKIIKSMAEYKISVHKLMELICDWETGKPMETNPNKNTSKGKSKTLIAFETEVKTPETFFVWHIQADNPWDMTMYDATVLQLKENLENCINDRSEFVSSSSSDKILIQPIMPTRTYSIFKEYATTIKSTLFHDTFCLIPQSSKKQLDGPEFNQGSFRMINKPFEKDDAIKRAKAWASAPLLSTKDEPYNEETIEPYWSLEPYESRKFGIQFRPSDERYIKGEFLLTFVDDYEATYKIYVEGTAAVPRLDMTCTSVFERVKSDKVNELYEPTYLINPQVFDFGNILVFNDTAKMHKKSAKLKLTNISVVPADVSLTLKNHNIENFDINPIEIKIEPSKTEYVDITASTSQIGTISDCLILSIKNNKNSEIIKLECNGIELDVEVDPKQINMNRILLYHTEKQIVTIQNNTAIAIYWRLSTEATISHIQFAPSYGKIKCNKSCEVEVQYNANQILDAIDTRFISLDLFLNENDTESIVTDVITITAEIYQIFFEVKSDTPIDLNSLPIGSTTNASFTIKNLGLYEIEYNVQYADVEVLRKTLDADELRIIEEDFNIQPKTGIILTKKQITINITYTPTVEINFESVPLFKCVIIEPYKNIGIVNEHLLYISAISYYTRFSVQPHPTLNFGSLGLKSTKIMQLKIENTGKFPLEYFIISGIGRSSFEKSISHKSNESVSKKNKNHKSSKSLVQKSSSSQNTSMKLGPFHLSTTQGELKPKETETLAVDCKIDSIGSFKETLFIIVRDSLPADQEKGSITLIANAALAQVDFKNCHIMFTKSYIVDTIEAFICPNELREHTVYSKTTNCLYFRRVCMEYSHTTYVTLRNTGIVSGDVIIEILEDSSSVDVFKVNSNRISIPPMSKSTFTLTFAPNLLGIFSSALKMTLDSPQNMESSTFFTYLQGEGYLPKIRILEPNIENTDNQTIDFGLIFISETCEKKLKIYNFGQIATELILTVIDDPNNIYSIYLDKDKNTVACNCPLYDNDSHNLTFEIIPEEIVNINIQFLPTQAEKYASSIKISINKNPYEIIEINLSGEGFVKPVILDNLEIIHPSLLNIEGKTKSRESIRKSRKSSIKLSQSATRSSSKIFPPNLLTYKLDYGKCFLNHMSKINFKIWNKSSKNYFRFEWNSHSNIICTPSAGHLAPNSYKELIATFLASEPILLSNVSLECIVREIILDDPLVESFWDTRQTQVSWRENYSSSFEFEVFEEKDVYVKKVVKETYEPEHEVVQTVPQTLQILVSAVADYSNYSCDIDFINFEDTLMFESRIYTFTLQNTGKVNLDYSWDLTMDEQFPIRLDQVSPLSFSTFESNVITSNETSDLFSSLAGMTDRSTDSWIEGENWPFEIIPVRGTIGPEESQECTLKFLPVDVFDYKAYLKCKIENLNPDTKPLNIIVTAKSLLPYCHFEIEKSDYLISGRRNMKLPGPPNFNLADPEIIDKIRVAEFKMMGIGECHIRYINLVNPTTEDYSYRWSRLSNDFVDKSPIVQCLSESGMVEKGKKVKVAFTYVPECLGVFESYWQFEIKSYDLKTLFLIVINVVDPSISYKNTLVQMEAAAIGEIKCCSFEIINNESDQLSFYIKPDSLYSEERLQTINVYPLDGILESNSAQKFCVEYKPSLNGEYTFSVECQIEKLKNPIKVYITAEVIEVLTKVIYFDTDDKEIEIKKDNDNIINYGQLMLCELTKLKFKIINYGQIAIDYSWNLKNINENSFTCSMSESEGSIDVNCDKVCHVEIMATDKFVIHNYPFALKIKYGPTYRFKLNASAKTPPIEFSFKIYDFGPCYIQTQYGTPYTVNLTITNHKKVPCKINCNFQKCLYLKLDLLQLAQAIPPNTAVKVPIYFQPAEEMFYQETLTFSTADYTIKTNVTVKGEGINYRIRLKNPCDSIIDFGKVLLGKSSCRKISLINEGCTSVNLKIVVIEFSSENITDACDSERYENKKEHIKNAFTTTSPLNFKSSMDLSDKIDITQFLKILPDTSVNLKACKEMEVKIIFKGIQRVKSLKAKIGLKIDYSIFPLTIVTGNCTAASFHLNKSHLSFGTVFEGCAADEKLVLVNDGDVGSRFNWDIERVKSYLNIKPLSGFCAVGSKITFICTFTPNCQMSYIQTEIGLLLKEHSNLVLSISGNCSPIPEAKETLDFTSHINQTETKEMEIQNDSNQVWSLTPMIFGECFFASSKLTLNPKDTNQIIVTYKPQKLTSKENLDKGKLVIILPDGRQPILYNLQGVCLPVHIVEKIIRLTPMKKNFTESLILRNNSNELKTFVCRTKPKDNNNKNPNKFQFDVPPMVQKHQKFSFCFENEGRFVYEITFENNEEKYRYEIEFIVTKPEIENLINLTTYVRSSIFYTVKIENPLEDKWITFDAKSTEQDIIIHDIPISLAPLEFKSTQIEYLPLLPCDKKATLEFSSEILGSIFYKLNLIAKPALPEKTINIESSLGSYQLFCLIFKNYSKDSCEFDITVDESSFTLPNYVTAAADEEVRIIVEFEPHGLEAVSATITATSSTAGEFIFPIIGKVTLPQAQGPFVVTSDTAALIRFKNVFLEPKFFEFSLDNPNFVINQLTKAKIDPQKIIEIVVTFIGNKNTDKQKLLSNKGKLIITCANNDLPSVKWKYYLTYKSSN